MENTQNGAPVPPTSDQDQAKKNEKIMSIISYIPILFLLPFFIVKDKSKTLNFHINQGIILSVLFVLGYFIANLLPLIEDRAVDLWKMIILIFTVIGIINVIKNREKPLPLIGKLLTLV